MSGLYVSKDDLKKLSETARQELLALCIPGLRYKEDEFPDGENTGVAVDLSSGQAIELVKGLSDKSRTALVHAIKILETADQNSKVGVWCGDIAKKMNIEVEDLRGVWSGLTRRTRRVTNNPEARLIHWLNWDYDREDYFGFIHPTTVSNLKRALDM